jgi:hypothetical protein
MDEKKLIIKFHKGVTYEVPARVIAENRAKYYAETDGYELDSNEYFDEVNRALDDEFLIFDWVQNNMDWYGLEPYAVWVENKSINLEDEWESGNHTISVNW